MRAAGKGWRKVENKWMEFKDFTYELDGKRQFTEEGVEYWHARDLQAILGYDTWQNFEGVILRAQEACVSMGSQVRRWFSEFTTPITSGKGRLQLRKDFYLTRFACYLVAMNGDPSKQEIAMAQAYFAVQTRKQEQFNELSEADKRIELRDRVKDHNKHLTAAAQKAGVQNYPKFQGEGYKGLYGGLSVKDVKARKGIPEKEDLLDCVNRTELAANDFRITQTEEQLAEVHGEDQATHLHFTVGTQVRAAIRNIGGKMPETLPAEPNIKLLRKEQKKRAKELTAKKPVKPELPE